MRLHYEKDAKKIKELAGSRVLVRGHSDVLSYTLTRANKTGILLGLCSRNTNHCSHCDNHIRIRYDDPHYECGEYCYYAVEIELDPDGNY